MEQMDVQADETEPAPEAEDTPAADDTPKETSEETPAE